MLEKFRYQMANLIVPKAKAPAGGMIINPFSYRTPGQPIYSELSVSKATRQGYKLSVWVYRAIRTIVQSVSGIPWIVIDNKTGEVIDGHEFTQVWSHPNPEFSGQDMMEYIIGHLKLTGNSLLMPLMVNGRPRQFWVCMPDMIQPIPSQVKGEWLSGYLVTEQDGKQYTVPPETFIHFMQFDPGNPYWGVGDLFAAARTVDTDNEAQDTQKISMQNRAVPDGVFVNENITTVPQWEEARRQIRENYLNKDNKRTPWVMSGQTKWYQMSLSPVEMDFIASRIQNVRGIAAAFGIDPWWLGDREHSTYNNVAEARKALYEDCGIPLLDDIKSTLNLKIAPLYGEDITIDYDLSGITALRDDFGKKVEQAKGLWSMGVPFDQINETLSLGFNEFEGWDLSYLPFSVSPAGGSAIPAETVNIDEAKRLTSGGENLKSINLKTEEQKKLHWLKVDKRREAWTQSMAKRVGKLYQLDKSDVLSAIEGKSEAEIMSHAMSAIDKRSGIWEKFISSSYKVVIKDFGDQTAEELGANKGSGNGSEKKWVFDPFSNIVSTWIRAQSNENIKTILSTQKDSLRKVIQDGFDQKLSTIEISRLIREFYDTSEKWMATRVARTTIASAAGYGQREAAKQSGIVKTHKWISSRDDRVRDSHQRVDGEESPIDEPYTNGLMFPGDPSGDASEVINCRCAESFGSEGE
jgi:HK97 family phage portal protein